MAETRMTQSGYNAKLKELNERENERRNEISEQIKYAKSLGDFSENAELDAAKAEENENEAKIAQLKYELETAKIIPAIIYKVHDLEDDEDYEYTLVGATESDVLNNMISDESPFGRAVKGKKEGDIALVKTSEGFYKVKIISITKE